MLESVPDLPLPSAWVVTCKACNCVITCFAIDPQREHMSRSQEPPQDSAQVACPCCFKTFRYARQDIRRGKMQPNEACRKQMGKLDGALLVGACLIAAIRMGSAEVRPSPKLTSTVADSVKLARSVLRGISQS